MNKITHRAYRGLFILIILCLSAQACSLTPASLLASLPAQTQNNPTLASPTGFHLINLSQGWLWINNQLFWTETGGDKWSEITPPGLGVWSIADVSFLNQAKGRLALISVDPDGTNHYAISTTQDGGKRWDFTPLSLFDSGDPAGISNKLSFYFIDDQTGWLVVKRSSSSAFNSGTLFRTLDGGTTWQKMIIPIGDPVYFVDATHGWTAGGAGVKNLFSTHDGGITWEQQQVVPEDTADSIYYNLPALNSTGIGLLPILITHQDQTRLAIFQTADFGTRWALSSETKVSQAGNQGFSFSALVDGKWTATFSDGEVLQGSSTGTETIARAALIQNNPGVTNKSVIPEKPVAVQGISHLDMASKTSGWAVNGAGDCNSAAAGNNAAGVQKSCASSSNLLQTKDGGLTWAAIQLPTLNPVPKALTSSQISTVTAQGFDTCEVPTVDQMATWISHSPYTVFNIYLGGSWLGCSKAKMSLVTNDYIGHLSQQGWKFIPTWVGLQAPCYCPFDPNNPKSPCNKKPQMSSDPTAAFTQGVTEANSAIETAANLGLTDSAKTNSIIYYDMEAFNTSDLTCRSAVKAFLDGWTNQLNSRLSRSGVYTTSCALSKLDLTSIKNVPNDVWLAYWFTPFQYRSNASVYNIYCFPDTLWVNHQRIHQYSGDHNETWGGVTVIQFDNDVLDGTVALWTNNGSDCPATNGVIFYWNFNFTCANSSGDTGYRLRQTTGWINVNDGFFDNKTSSVKVPACYTVKLYADTNLSGLNVTITADVADLTTLGTYPGSSVPVQGSVSSAMIIANSECIFYYFPFVPYNPGP